MLNDSPVDCQIPNVTEPQRERWRAKRDGEGYTISTKLVGIGISLYLRERWRAKRDGEGFVIYNKLVGQRG